MKILPRYRVATYVGPPRRIGGKLLAWADRAHTQVVLASKRNTNIAGVLHIEEGMTVWPDTLIHIQTEGEFQVWSKNPFPLVYDPRRKRHEVR